MEVRISRPGVSEVPLGEHLSQVPLVVSEEGGGSRMAQPARHQLLAVNDLHVAFDTAVGRVHAVNGVSLTVNDGETLGIVGESGSGKSATALALLGLLPSGGRVVEGSALFGGRDLLTMKRSSLRRIRGREVGMVFQNPMSSLNPVLRVGTQIAETLEAHFDIKRREARHQAIDLLQKVGIPSPEQRFSEYPHQFSGGMRQRAMIAMAIACEPRLLVADEPTTALDVTIQAQILELLKELVDERHMAMILITHDLGIVAGLCDAVSVMYAGMVVEEGRTSTLYAEPQHPYTYGLLQSVPRLDHPKEKDLGFIGGSPRDMMRAARACPFEPRCAYRLERCNQEVPQLVHVGSHQRAACFNPVPSSAQQEPTGS